MEESAARPARSRRPPRRPQRQQIVLRRALALGAGLIVLILIVIGVKGCLDARKNRALSDYSGDVTQIVEETKQTSKVFFAKLSDPNELSVTEFINEVNADRSAVDGYQARIDGLDAPGEMGQAQSALELTYDLRASAMNEIADEVDTALGEVGAEKATEKIAQQMEKLMASDVLYSTVVRPEIKRVLSDNGIEGEDPPESVFLPDETKWLEDGAVDSALSSVDGSGTGTETEGIHGLGLSGVTVNGVELSSESTTEVSLEEETPEVEVTVENQGESTENGIAVSISYGTGSTEGTIDSIAPLETSSVSIPLVPAPSGETTLEVVVDSVPGEETTENNEASYTVLFQ
ncbi:MAG TPA: CARDB domain-containing protein [Solirubrobacterales bacterium]